MARAGVFGLFCKVEMQGTCWSIELHLPAVKKVATQHAATGSVQLRSVHVCIFSCQSGFLGRLPKGGLSNSKSEGHDVATQFGKESRTVCV